jgi:lipopolysaccharide/colanic/teichoic acid biosynthesis glycosyltransferase
LIKRLFDFIFSLIILLFLSGFLLVFYILASLQSKSNGLYFQKRIGQYGKTFTIFKLKSMHDTSQKVTPFGTWMRKHKIDELPQFFNVLIGNMSIVGPRPDIEGYYDKLEGEDRKILELKPGITSEASLKYYNEEAILEQQENPLLYNDTVIFPDKVRMNLEYYYNRSFWDDLWIIWSTVFGYRF